MNYLVKEDVIKKDDQNGDFLLVNISIEDDCYYRVTGAAKFAWQKLSEGLTYENILDEMLKRFDTSKDQVSKDLNVFLDDLTKYGLISKSD